MSNIGWVRHEASAQRHQSLLLLRAVMGWAGYGLYWAIVEFLSEAQDFRLPMAVLHSMLGISKKKARRIVEDFGLFALVEEEGVEYVYSPRLIDKMEQSRVDVERIAQIKEARREAGRRGGQAKPTTEEDEEQASKAQAKNGKNASKTPKSAQAKLGQNSPKSADFACDDENSPLYINNNISSIDNNISREIEGCRGEREAQANEQANEQAKSAQANATDLFSEEEQAGGPKRKSERTKGFERPSVEEVQAYMEAKGYEGYTAREFVAFYESKGWMIGKNKMADWRSACDSWHYNAQRIPRPTYAQPQPQHTAHPSTAHIDPASGILDKAMRISQASIDEANRIRAKMAAQAQAQTQTAPML